MRMFLLVMLAAGLTTPALAKAVDMTPAEARSVTAVIQSAGFNCPLAKLAFAKGQDAYGTVVQVYCGPRASKGVYEKAVFKITRRPGGQFTVQPWK